MTIYIDADACPVVRIVERVANNEGIPVVLLCDTNHRMESDYSEVITVGAGADAVDFKLISLCRAGDIVVTQDYGVAAMAPSIMVVKCILMFLMKAWLFMRWQKNVTIRL